jgi:hypothetical protein
MIAEVVVLIYIRDDRPEVRERITRQLTTALTDRYLRGSLSKARPS